MGKGRKQTPEQIVSLLRQIEVVTSNGKINPTACREAGITEQTYYRYPEAIIGSSCLILRCRSTITVEHIRVRDQKKPFGWVGS
jgi:hypothetical protein